jgi:hypothetical protein
MYLYTIFYYRSSVCLELKFLASSDNLWQLRFTYEFGCQTESVKVKAPGQWKNIFAQEWCHQKRCLHHTKEVEQYLNNNCYNHRSGESTFPMLLRPQLSPFSPHIIPTMIGGDYDQFPSLNSSNMGAMLYQTGLKVTSHFQMLGVWVVVEKILQE